MWYGTHRISPLLVPLAIALIFERFPKYEVIERISRESNEYCVHVPSFVFRVLVVNVLAQYLYLLMDEFLGDVYGAFREEDTVCGTSLPVDPVGNCTKG